MRSTESNWLTALVEIRPAAEKGRHSMSEGTMSEQPPSAYPPPQQTYPGQSSDAPQGQGPVPSYGGTPLTEGAATQKPRRLPWIVGIVVAGLLGVIIGAAGSNSGDPAPAATTYTVTETVTAEDQGASSTETVTTTTTQTVTETVTATATAEPAEETERSSQDGTYSAGDFTFTDVQVSEDFGGSFELRTRATNNGQDYSMVSITATLFSGGSVVGTLTGVVSDWKAGQTRTVEFFSTDDYTEWDDIEFQIDMAF